MTTKQTYIEGCVCKCALMRVCTRKFVCENNESPRPRLQLLVSEREKKSIPRAPRVWLGAMNQGVHGYRPPLSDINHREQNASSSYSQNRWGPDLPPAPSCLLPSYLEESQTNKCIHWGGEMRGAGAGWLKVRSPGGALGQAGPCDPLPAEPVLSRELIWYAKQRMVRKEG